MKSSTISNTLLIILIIVVIFVAMNKFNHNSQKSKVKNYIFIKILEIIITVILI